MFDNLKIDRNSLPRSRTITKAASSSMLLGLSRSFGIRCTAEGIEEQAALDFLHGWVCTDGQGYLFGKPTEEAQLDGVRAQQAAAQNLQIPRPSSMISSGLRTTDRLLASAASRSVCETIPATA